MSSIPECAFMAAPDGSPSACQVLGGVLVLSGVAGYAGGARRSPSLVNLQLVASLVGILLAFSVISEVGRAGYECSRGEAH